MAGNGGSDILMNILYQLGGGFIMGFAVGYALKKLVKLALVVLGIFVMALLYLSNKGIIDVNYDVLAKEVEGALDAVGEERPLEAAVQQRHL